MAVKHKEISEPERRERAELRAANKAAREQKQKEDAEQEQLALAQTVYGNIWKQYDEDLREKGKNVATRNLLSNYSMFSEELLHVISQKDHRDTILELTDKLESESLGSNETPMEIVEKWLSGGIELSRVPLEPAIVAPTGNLDSRTSIEVMDIFQRLNIERGITVVLITHEVDIAEHGTRIVRFRDGRIQIDSKVEQRRLAANELKLLPQGEDDVPPPPLEAATAQPPAAH